MQMALPLLLLLNIIPNLTWAAVNYVPRGWGSEITNIHGGNIRCLSSDDWSNVHISDCAPYATIRQWQYNEQTQQILNGNFQCLNANGGNVEVRVCSESTTQKWSYDPATHEIKNDNGKCLDVWNYEGPNVILETCTGATAQIWASDLFSVFTAGADITNFHADIIKCLDVEGQNVQISNCDMSRAQQWYYSPSSNEIKNDNEHCLNANGGNIDVSVCRGVSAQKWYYNPTTLEIKNDNGQCLDEGPNVILEPCTGEKKQMWHSDLFSGKYGFVRTGTCESQAMRKIQDPIECRLAAATLCEEEGLRTDTTFIDKRTNAANGPLRPMGCSYHHFGYIEQWGDSTGDCDVNGFGGCFCSKSTYLYVPKYEEWIGSKECEWLEDFACHGSSWNEFSAGSKEECFPICKNTPGCNCITWVEYGNKCRLETGPTNYYIGAGYFSLALQSCVHQWIDHYTCENSGIVPVQFSLDSKSECVSKCTKTPGCKCATWVVNNVEPTCRLGFDGAAVFSGQNDPYQSFRLLCSLRDIISAQDTTCTDVNIDVYSNPDDAIKFKDVYGIASGVISSVGGALGIASSLSGRKGEVIKFGIDALLSAVDIVVDQVDDEEINLAKSFETSVNAEFERMEKCMGEQISHNNAKEEQKEIQKIMEIFDNRIDTDESGLFEFQTKVIDELEDFIIKNFNPDRLENPPPNIDPMTDEGIPFLPVFRETVNFYSTVSIDFLGAALAQCELNNMYGGYNACDAYDEKINDIKSDIDDYLFPWIEKVHKLIRKSYTPEFLTCDKTDVNYKFDMIPTCKHEWWGNWNQCGDRCDDYGPCGTFDVVQRFGGASEISTADSMEGLLSLKTSHSNTECNLGSISCPPYTWRPTWDAFWYSGHECALCSANVQKRVNIARTSLLYQLDEWSGHFNTKYIKPLNNFKKELHSPDLPIQSSYGTGNNPLYLVYVVISLLIISTLCIIYWKINTCCQDKQTIVYKSVSVASDTE